MGKTAVTKRAMWHWGVVIGVGGLLGACGGEDAEDCCAPPPPNGQQTVLTIEGRVTDAPIALAEVVASLGNRSFSATADSNGFYSLQVSAPVTESDRLLRLEARGRGQQSFVRFRSQLASLDTLVQQAGPDGSLSAGDNIRANVTHLSTAESAQLGSQLTGDADLEAALVEVDPERLLNTAASIKLLVDQADRYALPDSVTDTLAFAEQAGLVEQFVEDVTSTTQGQQDFQDAQTATADDPNVVAQEDMAGVPQRLVTIGYVPPMAYNYFNLVDVYQFEADGTGLVFDAVRDTSTTWSQSGNTLTVVPDDPERFEYSVADGSGGAINAVDTELHVEIVPLGNGIAQLRSYYETTYPDDPNASPETRMFVSNVRYLADADVRAAFPAVRAPVGSGVSADVYNTNEGVESRGLTADRLSFQSGGMGSAAVLGEDFTWTEGDDALSVNFVSGTRMRYRLGTRIDDCAATWLTESEGADASRRVDLGLAVCDSGAAFTPADIPGYYYQFGVGDEEASDDDVVGFGLRFDADGTGAQFVNEIRRVDEDGDGEPEESEYYNQPDSGDRRPLESYAEFYWALSPDNTVVIQRTEYYDGSSFYPGCEPGTADCYTWDRRELVPLTIDGQRFYWMEVRQFDLSYFGGSTEDTTYIQRFYDYSATEVPVDGGSKRQRLERRESESASVVARHQRVQ